MAANDDGHHYTFGSPRKGWPTFGPDGRIVKETDEQGTDNGSEHDET